MIDRLVHHADVVNLKGDRYRLKDRDLGRIPTDNTEQPPRPDQQGSVFTRRQGGRHSAAVDTSAKRDADTAA